MPIREAIVNDVETLHSIRKRVEPSVLGNDLEEIELPTMRDDVSNGKGCCLVYEVDGEGIAGFIYAQHSEPDGKRIGRIYLSIQPAYEGRRYSFELYRRCEARLREKGYLGVIFGTTEANVVIKRMGTIFGFRFLERRGSLEFYGKSL